MNIKKLLNVKVIVSVLLLVLSLVTFFITQTQKATITTRAWSRTSVKVSPICNNDGTISLQIKITNNESKSFTAIATDSQTGKIVEFGTVKSGDYETRNIETGKTEMNDGTIKIKVEWTDKSGSDTIDAKYSGLKCQVEIDHTRPIVVTDCSKDTWTIVGYEGVDINARMKDIDNFMVEIDGVEYGTIFPSGPWKGKNEIKFWIHAGTGGAKDTILRWDGDIKKVCGPTPTPTATVEVSPTPSPTKTPSPTRTPTTTKTPSPTVTRTNVPSNTPGPSPTFTPSPTPSNTPTATNTPTNTPTRTPTPTSLLSNTPGPSPTDTPTDTPTNTPTATNTPTNTPTHTPTTGPSATATTGPSATPTEIIVIVDSSTPAPTEDVTTVPTIPSVGNPIPFVLLAAPLLLLAIALLF